MHALLAAFPAGASPATPSWPRWRRPMSWPRGRWIGPAAFLSTGRAPQQAAVPDGRTEQARCCWPWSGCWLPGSRATPRAGGRAGAAAAGTHRGTAPAQAPSWARSCGRWRWSAWARSSSGRPGSPRRKRHLEQGIALAGGSGGRTWFSAAWSTRRAWSCSGRSTGRLSVPSRRSSWPGGTAGRTTRPPATPTGYSPTCWFGRGSPGSLRRPGCGGWTARIRPVSRTRGRPSRSTMCAAGSSWPAAGLPTRWPRSSPPSG